MESPSPQPPLPPIVLDLSPTSRYPLSTIHSSVGSWAFSYMVATVVVGAMILGAWALKVTHHYQFADAPVPSVAPIPRPEMVFVGRITGMVDCKWSDPSTEPFAGAYVPLGRKYALASGLMEITYDSGAKVILQGPCTYEVESNSGGYLALGKLTAKVEKRGEGRGESANPQAANLQISNPQSLIPNPLFVVRTPTAVVTDLGTEFGVEVEKSGATQSHVFQGKVELRRATNGIVGSLVGRFEEGETVRVDATGAIVQDVPLATDFFVRTRGFLEAQLNVLRRRRAVSLERFRNDPALVAYYAFDNEREAPDRLLNRAAATAGRLNGLFGESGRPETRPTWTDGHCPGKRALCFDAGKQQAVVVPHDDLLNVGESMTIVARVKHRFPMPPRGCTILSRRRDDEWPPTVNYQFSVVGPHEESPYSIQLYTDGAGRSECGPVFPKQEEWWHVAAAQAPGYKQFYLGGRLVDQASHAGTSPKLQVDLWIGATPPWANGRYPFDGLMDEIWIFKRVLSPSEIRALCNLGTSLEK